MAFPLVPIGIVAVVGYLAFNSKKANAAATLSPGTQPKEQLANAAATQTVTAQTPIGTVTVVTPAPQQVTPTQSRKKKDKSKPAPKTEAGRPKTEAQPTPQGEVYGPAKVVQPDGNGNVQPVPVVITPSGAASIVVAGVKDAQSALNALGVAKPPLVVDGKIGPKTVAAIKVFQKRVGLATDGNAGPATLSALAAAIASLAQTQPSPPPQAVQAAAAKPMSNSEIQTALNKKGAKPALVADGKLGPKSVAAIKTFQLSRGLTADGIAGPATQAALRSA